MGDHPAVGEHLGRLAERVDERLVEPALVGDLPHLCEVGRSFLREPRPHRFDALPAFDREVVGAGGDRGIPHGHLADQTGQEGAQGWVVVDAFHRDLDGRVELLVGKGGGAGDHLAHKPDMVLDHLVQQVHGSLLRTCGQPQAARRMEVHVARGFDLHPSGVAAPLRRACPMGPGEGSGERLVRSVAGLDRDVEDRAVGGHQPIRRPLEQNPSTKRRRRLTGDRRDDAVEVEPRQVNARGEVLAGSLVVVQCAGEDVHECGEGVGRDVHEFILGDRRGS